MTALLSHRLTVLYGSLQGSVAPNPQSSVYLQTLLIVTFIHLYCLCIVEKGAFQIGTSQYTSKRDSICK
jgi:hypothetical protein